VLLVLYSVFPILSAFIFQTFLYDTRLNDGTAFLKADYSIEYADPSQQSMEAYAIGMSLLYCFGIPTVSYILLRWKERPIQQLKAIEAKLQKGPLQGGAARQLHQQKADLQKKEPMLEGLSFLYQDYEPQYWWWEVLRFVCTLLLSGLVGLSDLQDGTQIFAALLISTAMLVAIANCSPYLSQVDDVLAQTCQTTLSLAMAIGLLDKAIDQETGEDSLASFGWVLTTCVTVCWVAGFGAIGYELFKVALPKQASRVQLTRQKVFMGLSKGAANAVTPFNLSGETGSGGTSEEERMAVELQPLDRSASQDSIHDVTSALDATYTADDLTSNKILCLKALQRTSSARQAEL